MDIALNRMMETEDREIQVHIYLNDILVTISMPVPVLCVTRNVNSVLHSFNLTDSYYDQKNETFD